MVIVTTDKFFKMKNNSLAEHGIHEGDPLYIGGSGFVPSSKTDPYKYRLLFVASKVVDGHIDVGDKGFAIDAKNLKKCSLKELKVLEKNKNEDFGPKEEEKALQGGDAGQEGN